MRIAFVGKGGSGKSTLTALFSQFVDAHSKSNQWLVDADLNMNLGKLLTIESPSESKYLSSTDSVSAIRNLLIGNNPNIKSIEHFKKTTPPSKSSGYVDMTNKRNEIFNNYSTSKNNSYLSVVGSYQGDGVGTSCYHNNLSIFENILSHSYDKNAYIIVDMVAGIDAFAGTLHSQFDVLIYVAEPTVKSLDVYCQYLDLARSANVESSIFVVGNKVRDEKDQRFIKERVDEHRIVGYLEDSEHIRNVDKGLIPLDYSQLMVGNQDLFGRIQEILESNVVQPQARLNRLYELHMKYISQGYIQDRFGDLSAQIDHSFDIEKYFHESYSDA